MENIVAIANIIASLSLVIALIFAIYKIMQMKRATYATSFSLVKDNLQAK